MTKHQVEREALSFLPAVNCPEEMKGKHILQLDAVFPLAKRIVLYDERQFPRETVTEWRTKSKQDVYAATYLVFIVDGNREYEVRISELEEAPYILDNEALVFNPATTCVLFGRKIPNEERIEMRHGAYVQARMYVASDADTLQSLQTRTALVVRKI